MAAQIKTKCSIWLLSQATNLMVCTNKTRAVICVYAFKDYGKKHMVKYVVRSNSISLVCCDAKWKAWNGLCIKEQELNVSSCIWYLDLSVQCSCYFQGISQWLVYFIKWPEKSMSSGQFNIELCMGIEIVSTMKCFFLKGNGMKFSWPSKNTVNDLKSRLWLHNDCSYTIFNINITHDWLHD